MSRRHAQRAATERLRDTGARCTPARVRVLAALRSSKEALSHAELEEALAPRRLDRVTLYRVLDWLVGQRLAHRMSGSDGVWRFSAAEARHGEHAHFQCSRCGKLVCLEETRLRGMPAVVPRGYRAEGVEMTVRGICPGCV